MNDEKKVEMTEEEIVKALVNTKKTLENLHEDDDDYDKLSLLKKINNSSLWLIHRLQSEVQRLAKVEMGLIGKIAEKDKEIERLTEEYEDKLAWQEVDIQQLTEENAELQKQVDELTEECSNKQYEIERLEAEKKFLQEQANILAGVAKRYSEDKEQDVKDTVAKIIVELNRTKNIVRENYGISEQVGVDIAINRVDVFYKELTEGKV